MSDIVFMDTETLGLSLDSPIWEFAAIRRTEDGAEQEFHCFIDHYPLPWIDSLPDQFANDYRARYKPDQALTQYHAADVIIKATKGAHVVGAVPNFDTERLQRLLVRSQSLLPGERDPWRYHLIDIENVVVGYLVGVGKQAVNSGEIPELDMSLVVPPWRSDELSAAVGVDPEQFDRHTAMGDVLWVRAQYDAVMGGAS